MSLTAATLGDDPLAALRGWLEDARLAGAPLQHTFVLATVDETGAPDARVVVVRDCADGALTFHADTGSAKGRQLAAEPRATLAGHWPELGRQVRARGTVRTVSAAEADAVFAERDRQWQIGQWATETSMPIEDRDALEARLDAAGARFEGVTPPRPPTWTVYRLEPTEIEFWQAGERHLHDRILYRRTPLAPHWHPHRLQP